MSAVANSVMNKNVRQIISENGGSINWMKIFILIR